MRAQGSMGWTPGQALGRPDPNDWPVSASVAWLLAVTCAAGAVFLGAALQHLPATCCAVMALIFAHIAGARVEGHRVRRRREQLRTARDVLFLAAMRRSPYFDADHARAAARELHALLEETRCP